MAARSGDKFQLLVPFDDEPSGPGRSLRPSFALCPVAKLLSGADGVKPAEYLSPEHLCLFFQTGPRRQRRRRAGLPPCGAGRNCVKAAAWEPEPVCLVPRRGPSRETFYPFRAVPYAKSCGHGPYQGSINSCFPITCIWLFNCYNRCRGQSEAALELGTRLNVARGNPSAREISGRGGRHGSWMRLEPVFRLRAARLKMGRRVQPFHQG